MKWIKAAEEKFRLILRWSLEEKCQESGFGDKINPETGRVSKKTASTFIIDTQRSENEVINLQQERGHEAQALQWSHLRNRRLRSGIPSKSK